MSSKREAEIISKSPSLSISAINTDEAPSAEMEISVAVQVGLAAPSFSYQAMVSSKVEADTISKSPSLSRSETYTSLAPSAVVAISVAVQEGLAAPSFSYQAIVSSPEEAETISKSPSLSMSAICISLAPAAEVAMVVVDQEGLAAPSFSYQAILLSIREAETISKSPSLSISAM